MDAAAVVLASILGIAVGPILIRVIDTVPARAWVGADGGGAPPPADHHARDRAVRVLAPVLLGLAAVRWGWTLPLVPFLFLFAVLLVVSVIDLEHYRIPDRVTFPALAISIPLVVAVSLVEDHPDNIKTALVGAVAYFTLLLVPHLVYPQGLGFGDVKLGLLMGLYLGWMYADVLETISLVMWALVLGSGLGVLVGVGFMVVRKKRAEFPFGPALAAGCVLAVLFSDQIVG
jgi:prepilin signal peptidase PulO-like enzyme (type II secretory pathway)